MSLGKQSKVLTDRQIEALLAYLSNRRNGVRNRVILHLSVKAGLRAKEIACLKWAMVVNADGVVGDAIHLTNIASKGASGRVIPLNKALKESLLNLWQQESSQARFDRHVIRSERSPRTSAQSVVNMFQRWYRDLNYVGCSSHSGRRTFITNTARKISLVGGSLRDVQSLAGHSNLQTTQRYIDHDTDCQRKVVNLL
jgi:integrase/recombinase XerD